MKRQTDPSLTTKPGTAKPSAAATAVAGKRSDPIGRTIRSHE